jgi:hydrogenase nickel incorporation protein HypB
MIGTVAERSPPPQSQAKTIISSFSLDRVVHKVSDISMEADILAENRKLGHDIHHRLHSHNIRSVDVMGSIGAGKTLLIQKMAVEMQKRGIRAAVLAGDVTGQDDFDRFRAADVPAVNVNTGKECHLDAHLVDHALDELDLDSIDFLFVENVGNLVCPADFPLGTDHRMVVISVTEGDDMIRKQPLIFLESDIAVLNKIDLLPHMDMDATRLDADYAKFKKGARLFRTSAKTGEGIEELFRALNIHA